MSTPFSDTINNTGFVQQIRSMARVDASQWPTWNIANSLTNYKNKVAGYAIGADKRYRWDDTNHTELPEGKRDLSSGVTDYSFLTDEQGNIIITLIKVDILLGGYYTPLQTVDDADIDDTFGQVSGVPSSYKKIADNVIRLDCAPTATITDGLRFTFQRSPVPFTATDTTETTGFAPILDRGFVIAGAYDIALTLGLENLQPLSVEMQKEEQAMRDYFGNRGMDNDSRLTMRCVSFR